MNTNFEILKGKTLSAISGSVGDDEMVFTTDEGEKFKLFHYQDCCETVSIDDICGDLNDLIGVPITESEESSNSDNPPDNADSFTWTFYKLRTEKGYVTIRWLGESNGYYSESVDFEKCDA